MNFANAKKLSEVEQGHLGVEVFVNLYLGTSWNYWICAMDGIGRIN